MAPAPRAEAVVEERDSMLKDMKIGRRLALAFGLVLALMATVSAAGYWGLETVAGLAREILNVSSPLVEHSQRARANTLGLRRFEKDYFLNIGSPEQQAEYLAKWKDQKARLDERLGELDVLSQTEEDRQTVRAMWSIAPLSVPPDSVIPEASVSTAPLSTISVPPATVCAPLIVALCAISSVLLLVSSATGLIVTPLWSTFSTEPGTSATAKAVVASILPVRSSVPPEAVTVRPTTDSPTVP
jgi:hypothetical protein